MHWLLAETEGIGKTICLRLADMGYNIILNYTSNDEKQIKQKIC